MIECVISESLIFRINEALIGSCYNLLVLPLLFVFLQLVCTWHIDSLSI